MATTMSRRYRCNAARLLVLLLAWTELEERVVAFDVSTSTRRGTKVRLAAHSRAQHKQAALRQKMEAAKRQSETSTSTPTTLPETDAEIRQRNDRLRFEELLRNGVVLSDADEYRSRQQEEEEIDAVRAGKDRLLEGDPAPTDCFEDLVSIKSENAIGANGKQRLVPWLHKSAARHDDYLAIVTDPRPQSPELRDTIKSFDTLPADIQSRLIVINADSPAENRRWLKKNGRLESTPLVVYADEKMEWMRSYTALGENRWTMTLFIIGNGKVRKLARDVDRYSACRTILNAVKALDEKYV